MPPPTSRRPALDGLRGLAVLAVFASHTGLPGTDGGWIGVEIFFVLSGYLITGLLLREWNSTQKINFLQFYRRRLLRLYPALLALLAIGLVFYRQLGDGGTLAGYARSAGAAAFYVQDFVAGFSGAHGGFGHTWTLAVEEQFYLLWPPLLFLLIRKNLAVAKVALLCIGLSLVATFFFADDSPIPNAYWLPWTHCAALLAGCALAARPIAIGNRAAHLLGVTSLVGLAGLLIAAHIFSRHHYLLPEIFAAALLSCGLVAAVEASPTSLTARVLSYRPLAYVGLISYSLYLYSVTIFLLPAFLPLGRSANAVVALAAAFGCAALSYRYIERPFLALGRRQPAPASASATTR